METARALAHAGARVILTSRSVSAGEGVVAKLKNAGVKVCTELGKSHSDFDQETYCAKQALLAHIDHAYYCFSCAHNGTRQTDTSFRASQTFLQHRALSRFSIWTLLI